MARYATKGETNSALVDRFTAMHAAFGAGMGATGFSTADAVLISILWETVEAPMKKQFPKAFPSQLYDSPQNKVGDVLAVAVGCALSRRIFHEDDTV